MRSNSVSSGRAASRIISGDTSLTSLFDQFRDETFDYFLTNPPFGVDWKRQQKEIQGEHDKRRFAGRFGAGLPRVNDGSLLFLQHMLSKMRRPE